MMIDAPPGFRALSEQEGDAIWTFNFLAVRKLAAEQTGGRLEAAEFVFPAGFSPPWHVHYETDESFYVLEGEIRFHCGEDLVQRVGPGGFVSLPARVPHSFYVESAGGARVLHTGSPGGLWDFHAACGRPADYYGIPEPEPIDGERVAAIAARYGIEILGPPLSA
jgi:quercetin dioxygenase-like cupin family protein